MRAEDVLDHVVVGAGLTGLAYAWRRRCEGARVVLLEAGENVGGSVRPTRLRGFLLTHGRDALVGAAPHLAALAGALGLEDPAPEEAGVPIALVGPGGRRRILPWDGRLRRRKERPRRRADTLARALRPTLGVGGVKRAVEPVAQAVFGCPADRLGAVEVLPSLVGRRAAPRTTLCLPAGSLLPLLDAFETELAGAIECGVRVEGLERGDAAWRVHAQGRSWAAKAVALALPAAEQARLLAPHAPHRAEGLAALPRGRVAAVALVLPPGDAEALPGAFVVPRPRSRLRAGLVSSRLDARRAPRGRSLVEVRLAGAGLDDTSFEDDGLLSEIASAELAALAGRRLDARTIDVRRLRPVVPSPGHRARSAEHVASLLEMDVRLLGGHVTGPALDARLRAGRPVAGPLLEGVTLA